MGSTAEAEGIRRGTVQAKISQRKVQSSKGAAQQQGDVLHWPAPEEDAGWHALLRQVCRGRTQDRGRGAAVGRAAALCPVSARRKEEGVDLF